jgi:hypothetical protein
LADAVLFEYAPASSAKADLFRNFPTALSISADFPLDAVVGADLHAAF